MAEPNRDSAGSQDIIDDALRLADALQRKLIVAGVRRGVGNTTATPPPSKGDVWEEAVREPEEEEPPALEQVIDIARSAGPEVAGHLGRAGGTLLNALGQAWQVVERSLEQERARREQRDDHGSGEPPPQLPRTR
ncbi:hypothetical protein [Salinactinospora qingdaonensis]